MSTKVINFNFDVPADKKEILIAFQGLMNAFKSDIKIKEIKKENAQDNIKRLEEFKKQFGHLEYKNMPTKEDLADIRTKRYAQ
ncbi:MAG: hypothetical protein GX170_03640 [Campylobacteraceae bacterium]|jgi:hypothetical protein|nr:hypothetical protein [Campylobacteraceae bacterium]